MSRVAQHVNNDTKSSVLRGPKTGRSAPTQTAQVPHLQEAALGWVEPPASEEVVGLLRKIVDDGAAREAHRHGDRPVADLLRAAGGPGLTTWIFEAGVWMTREY